MSYSSKNHKNKFLFLPIGGAGEIGMNLNLYHYQGKWIIIDMGIGFANGTIPGVDVVVPDVEFLQKIKKDILAIVITHAHEDHLGAVQYLWEYFPAPIYTTKFNAEFLKTKLERYSFKNKVKYNIQKADKEFKIGKFSLTFTEINHSVPEMNAVLLKVAGYKVFHTGDWKFDKNPVIGAADDFKKLEKIGDQEIDAMVCDSTNVLSEGHSGSEGDLQESLIELISKQKSLVIVTSFASNVGRILTIAKAAAETNRKLIVCGAALERIIMVSKKSGYIPEGLEIVSPTQFSKYKRKDILIMATGCQGEERAAMNRMAHNTYPNIKLTSDDTVIFSSKIIPGNDKKIIGLFNKLAERKVKVLTERDHFVHVSGHPNREELKKMYKLIRPRISIPVHGETFHLYEHCKFAKKLGVENVADIANGRCVEINEEGFQNMFSIKAGYVAVDGNSLVDAGGVVIKERRKLAESGIVIIHILLDKAGLADYPEVRAPGLFCLKKDIEIIEYLEEKLYQDLKNKPFLSKKGKKKGEGFEQALINESKAIIKKSIKESINKFPFVEVFITYLDQ